MQHLPAPRQMSRAVFSITMITTGGTIAKTYDPVASRLVNRAQVVAGIVRSLRIQGADIRFIDLMHKDSLDITSVDRGRIVRTVEDAMPSSDAIIVTHGTDTLLVTADALVARTLRPPVPVILTGACWVAG